MAARRDLKLIASRPPRRPLQLLDAVLDAVLDAPPPSRPCETPPVWPRAIPPDRISVAVLAIGSPLEWLERLEP